MHKVCFSSFDSNMIYDLLISCERVFIKVYKEILHYNIGMVLLAMAVRVLYQMGYSI